jgi:hypothetical protein
VARGHGREGQGTPFMAAWWLGRGKGAGGPELKGGRVASCGHAERGSAGGGGVWCRPRHGSGGSGDGLRPGAGEVDRGRAPGRGPARWEKEVGPTQLNNVDFRFKTNFKLNKI